MLTIDFGDVLRRDVADDVFFFAPPDDFAAAAFGLAAVFGVTFLFGDLAPLVVFLDFAAVERELAPVAFLAVDFEAPFAFLLPPEVFDDDVLREAVDLPAVIFFPPDRALLEVAFPAPERAFVDVAFRADEDVDFLAVVFFAVEGFFAAGFDFDFDDVEAPFAGLFFDEVREAVFFFAVAIKVLPSSK